jgi:hypothetical protein
MASERDRVTSPSTHTQPDGRLHPHLPVTAEVGSEGGSYSDPTHQVATFENDVSRVSSRADTPVSEDSDPNHGMIRYPSEPPAPPSATEGFRAAAPAWRAAVIGGVAGAVTVVALELLRRRVRDQRHAADTASKASALDQRLANRD